MTKLQRRFAGRRATMVASVAVMCLASPALAQEAPKAASANTDAPASLDDIVVTAKSGPQKVRSQSLSQTALTGANLEAIGAQSAQDYLTRTPGVVLNAGTPGNSSVAIRGVGTTTGLDQGQSPTGYYINDIPLTDPYYSVGTPDIDTFDVGNVSIYRGPQATLFGAASLGGAINYQATLPNLERFEMRMQGTGQIVDRSGGGGGSAKAMLNVPLVNDKLALRAVYIYRNDPGFVENNGTGDKNSNDTVVRGGRAEITWKPTSSTTLNYSFLTQKQNTRDVGYSSPTSQGRYGKSTLFPERANFKTQLNSLRLDQDLQFAVFTATATYHEKHSVTANDLTGFLSTFFGAGGGPYKDGGPSSSKGDTFEGRLASNPDDQLSYLVGVYHDSTRERLREDLNGLNQAGVVSFVDAVYGPLVGDPMLGEHTAADGYVFRSATNTAGEETAVFGDVTYRLSDVLKVNVGGRYFWTSLKLDTSSSGLFQLLTAGALSTTSAGIQREKGFTPKGSITWTPNKEFMVYGLISKGFRFGGPNLNPPEPGFTTPSTFKSDSLTNYEIGFRTDWFNHRLQFDPSFFYIDWSDIQLRLSTPAGFAYASNAGKAKNYGVEFATVLVPTDRLRIQNNITYLSAELNNDFAPGGGQAIVPKGSRLPGSSKWQISTAVSYTIPDLFGSRASILASQRYISRAPGIFGQGVTQGGYSLYDLRFNFKTPGGLEITPFVENIANRRGVTSAVRSPLAGFREYIVRPRTFGITLDYRR